MDIKKDDMVFVLDQECVEHCGEGTCCSADFTKPVKVIDVWRDFSYPVEIEFQDEDGKLKTCVFDYNDVRKAGEGEY